MTSGRGVHVLGIDIGTTAVKTILLDDRGAVTASAEAPSSLYSPHPGWAEADADRWWQAVMVLVPQVMAAAGITAGDIAAVGVSGMVPTLVPIDAGGRVLRRSIQQNDARAFVEIDELRALVPDALVRTGSAVTAQSIGPKWQWLQRHEPGVVHKTAAVLGSYGFIVFMLTGVMTAEANWALESGLSGVAGGWLDDVCAAVGLDQRLLPDQYAPGEIVGEISAAVAAAVGLCAGTPVIAGCADHVASAFGAGLLEPGDLLIKLGGAGDILLVTDLPAVDERLYLDRHPDGLRWLPNGCMASSGSLLRWFSEQFAGGTPMAELDAQAADVPPTANGLLVLPYFLGEKTPLNDPSARGAIVGLHLGHSRADVYRAMLEAVAFGFVHHLEVIAQLDLDVAKVTVTNGGSRSRLWRQIVADATGLPLASLVVNHGSSFGTAVLAGAAVGLFDTVDVIATAATPEEIITPNPHAVSRLAEHYERWRALELAIRPISHELTKAGRQ